MHSFTWTHTQTHTHTYYTNTHILSKHALANTGSGLTNTIDSNLISPCSSNVSRLFPSLSLSTVTLETNSWTASLWLESKRGKHVFQNFLKTHLTQDVFILTTESRQQCYYQVYVNYIFTCFLKKLVWFLMLVNRIEFNLPGEVFGTEVVSFNVHFNSRSKQIFSWLMNLIFAFWSSSYLVIYINFLCTHNNFYVCLG